MTSPLETQCLQAVCDAVETLAQEKDGLEALGRTACSMNEALEGAFVTVLAVGIDSQIGYLVTSSLRPGLSPKPLDPGLLLTVSDRLVEDRYHEKVGENDALGALLVSALDIPNVQTMSRKTFPAGRRLKGVVFLGKGDLEESGEAGDVSEGGGEAESAWRRAFDSFTHVFALALRHNPMLDRMKEQTRRMRPTTPSGPMGTDVLLRYREFFESSSDGAFIVDDDGKVAYLNHVAEVLTGYSSDWLVGRRVLEVVEQTHREGFVEVLKRILGGDSLKSFDVDLETTSGDLICVHMAVALLSGPRPLVALTFKDMTATRVVEQELLKTKEFLERIIQSTVDAIVCADNKGKLTLFNVGAERLFGYSAENVVGHISFDDLFPGEEGATVMKNLHSTGRGGEGRLEPIRVEVLARDGERVPVQLTASVITDVGEQVGVVVSMSDLRDRIRMERRYQEIQDQYLKSQKQALVAELAGTTAHELNQPLTSIMGYAEIMDRRIEEGSPNRRAVETILSEAERMAEIVKKIGKITRYETKAYVGTTQILDLDKSTD